MIEVILATAILLGSVVVLAELAGIGRRQSEKGQKLAQAQQLCEQTLNEVLIGLRPLEPQQQEPLLPAQPLLGTGGSESRFEELAATLEPFPIEEPTSTAAPVSAPTSEIALAESSEWVHSLQVTPLQDHPGLALLTVVVEQPPGSTGRPVRFELSRWIDETLASATEEDFSPVPTAEIASAEEVVP